MQSSIEEFNYFGEQTPKVQLIALNQISQTWYHTTCCSLLIKNPPELSG